MLSAKRLSIATVLGLVFGFLSWLVAGYVVTTPIPWSGAVTIILGRGALGFAIGLSAWRISWWLHGLLLGFIFSLPAAFAALLFGMNWNPGFLAVLLGGLLIGFLIEFMTTVAFRAGVAAPPA